jgi:hypothetical protein
MLGAGALLAGNGPTTAPAAQPAKPEAARAPAPATAPATAPTTRTADQKKQDDIDRVLQFLKRTQPDVYEQALAARNVYEQALAARTSDPARFEKLIVNALSIVDKLEAIRASNPELFELSMRDVELNYKSLRLAHELKRSDLGEKERTHMMAQLKAVISQEFNVQQKIRQCELDALRKQVKDLDDKVKARESSKDTIIQKRTDDLLNGAANREW